MPVLRTRHTTGSPLGGGHTLKTTAMFITVEIYTLRGQVSGLARPVSGGQSSKSKEKFCIKFTFFHFISLFFPLLDLFLLNEPTGTWKKLKALFAGKGINHTFCFDVKVPLKMESWGVFNFFFSLWRNKLKVRWAAAFHCSDLHQKDCITSLNKDVTINQLYSPAGGHQDKSWRVLWCPLSHKV